MGAIATGATAARVGLVYVWSTSHRSRVFATVSSGTSFAQVAVRSWGNRPGCRSLIMMRSRRSVLGPHRIGNLRIRADTGGHDRYEGIPGHGTFSPTTSAAGTIWRRVRIPPGGGRVCTLTNEAGVILNEPRDRLSRSAYAGAGPFVVLTLWADGGVDLPIVEAPNWGY